MAHIRIFCPPQKQCRGLAHRPRYRLQPCHGQLLQRRYRLIAINDHVTPLSAGWRTRRCSQRRFELVKLQLHQTG